jgi:hypothetical protein
MSYRILVVCSGNMCRSPMAKALLDDANSRRGASGNRSSEKGMVVGVGRAAVLASKFQVPLLALKSP